VLRLCVDNSPRLKHRHPTKPTSQTIEETSQLRFLLTGSLRGRRRQAIKQHALPGSHRTG